MDPRRPNNITTFVLVYFVVPSILPTEDISTHFKQPLSSSRPSRQNFDYGGLTKRSRKVPYKVEQTQVSSTETTTWSLSSWLCIHPRLQKCYFPGKTSIAIQLCPPPKHVVLQPWKTNDTSKREWEPTKLTGSLRPRPRIFATETTPLGGGTEAPSCAIVPTDTDPFKSCQCIQEEGQ